MYATSFRFDHHALGLSHLGVVHILDEALHVLVCWLPGICSGVPSWTISPSFMIATRCPTSSASSRSSVDEDDRPLDLTLDVQKRFCMSRRISGSSAGKELVHQ